MQSRVRTRGSGVTCSERRERPRRRVGRAHQRLPHEHRATPRSLEPAQLLGTARSPTRRRPSRRPGSRSSSRSVRSTSTLKSRRSRLLIPISSASNASAPRQLRRGRAPPPARPARAFARARCSAAQLAPARAPPRSAAPRRRPPPAPRELVLVDDEVLAQDRQLAGRARRAQILQAPSKLAPSVSTESAPRRRARRRPPCSGRSAPRAASPAEGERRLNSAITPMLGPPERGREAPRSGPPAPPIAPADARAPASGRSRFRRSSSSRVLGDDPLQHGRRGWRSPRRLARARARGSPAHSARGRPLRARPRSPRARPARPRASVCAAPAA